MREPGQRDLGLGPLEGDERGRVRLVVDLTECADVFAEVSVVFLDVGGVHDYQEVVARNAVDNQVIDDTAARMAGHGIHGSAITQGAHVIGDQALHGLGGARSAKMDFAHMADVEDAHGAARGLVLLDDAGRVVHRHEPAAKVDQLRTKTLVCAGEGGCPGLAVGVHGRRRSCGKAWPGTRETTHSHEQPRARPPGCLAREARRTRRRFIFGGRFSVFHARFFTRG